MAAKRRVEEAEAARCRDNITHRNEVDKMKKEAEALADEIARLEFQVCGSGSEMRNFDAV